MALLAALSVLAFVRLTTATLPVKTIYQFASNTTWLENLSIRPNGLILATEIGPPASLLQFNASTPLAKPETIVTFDTVLGLSGIAQGAPDVFYVTGANTTGSNIQDPPTNATHVWKVDFTKTNSSTGDPDITLLARPQAPTGFNGLTAYNDTLIFASASYQDSIFAIDTTNGNVWEALVDPLMSGINGVKYQEPYIYWAASGAFARARVFPNLTISAGEAIASTSSVDDFAVAPVGFQPSNSTANSTGRRYAYLTTAAQNSIEQISWNEFGSNGTFDSESVIVAGNVDSTEVAEPTACFFGLDNELFITTGGGSGVNVNVSGVETAVGAQLLEVRL